MTPAPATPVKLSLAQPCEPHRAGRPHKEKAANAKVCRLEQFAGC